MKLFEQPYFVQHTNALLPSNELYLAYKTLCFVIERTRLLLDNELNEIKRVLHFHNSSDILINGRKRIGVVGEI